MKPEENKKPKFELSSFLKEYLYPTLSIIVLILVVSLVTIPTVGKIQQSIKNVQDKKEEIENLDDFVSKLKDLEDNISEISADSLIVDQYLPKDSRVSTFIDEVNYLAEQSGLESNELSGSETIQKDDEFAVTEGVERPRRVLVTFNYKGSFDEVYRLFEEINNYKKLLSVQSVVFSRSRTDWSIEITVASYNLPQEVIEDVITSILDSKSLKRIETVDEETLNTIKERV